MSSDPVFFLRVHLGETISSFFMVLGLLLVWVFVKKKTHVFASPMSKRMAGGALAGLVSSLGLVAGLALPQAHSWGNLTYGVSLGMQHTYRFFTNDSNLLIIGLLYMVFEIVGAILAFGVFIVYVYAYNFFEKDAQKHIMFTEIFKWEKEQSLKVFVKDGVAALILAFAVLGSTNFKEMPSAWPPSDTSVVLTILIVGMTTTLIVGIIGKRAIIALNPLAWVSAFIIKLSTSLYLNRKSITLKNLTREIASPVAVLGVSAVAGLLVSLILSQPFTAVPGE